MTAGRTDRTWIVGIAGHRSFISWELVSQLRDLGIAVRTLDKDSLGSLDLTGYDCVYLILGRARPSEEEMDREVRQLSSFVANPLQPRRAVYLSSRRQTRAKEDCERIIVTGERSLNRNITVLRPPAVFGASQSLQSEMLIPSLVREPLLELERPNVSSRFIHVGDLARHMAMFADPYWNDPRASAYPGSIYDIPGTFTVTSAQIRALYTTFLGLQVQSRIGQMTGGIST